ncbi:MAG: hypothetical protein OXH86_18800 [Acidimicrobiaceae bacterium]|nr:hypothetical protein [Acidimicrobiaceae bacterium]
MSRSKFGRFGKFRATVRSFFAHLTSKNHQRVKHPFEDAARTIKEASHVTRGTGTGPAHRFSPVDRGIEQVAADGYRHDEGSHRG